VLPAFPIGAQQRGGGVRAGERGINLASERKKKQRRWIVGNSNIVTALKDTCIAAAPNNYCPFSWEAATYGPSKKWDDFSQIFLAELLFSSQMRNRNATKCSFCHTERGMERERERERGGEESQKFLTNV